MLCSIEEKRIYQIIFQAVPLAAFHPETSACGSSEQGSALSEVGREITTLLRSLRSGFRSRSSLLTSLRWPLRALHIANSSKIVSASYRTRTVPSVRKHRVCSLRAPALAVGCIPAAFSPGGALVPLLGSSL